MENSNYSADIKGLAQKHGQKIYAFSLLHLRDCDDARDVTEEVFHRAQIYKTRLTSDEYAECWLFRTAYTCIKRMFSSKWRSQKRKSDSAKGTIPEELSGLWRALSHLPDRFQSPLFFSLISGKSADAIALILDISRSQSKTHILRAVQIVQKRSGGLRFEEDYKKLIELIELPGAKAREDSAEDDEHTDYDEIDRDIDTYGALCGENAKIKLWPPSFTPKQVVIGSVIAAVVCSIALIPALTGGARIVFEPIVDTGIAENYDPPKFDKSDPLSAAVFCEKHEVSFPEKSFSSLDFKKAEGTAYYTKKDVWQADSLTVTYSDANNTAIIQIATFRMQLPKGMKSETNATIADTRVSLAYSDKQKEYYAYWQKDGMHWLIALSASSKSGAENAITELLRK